MPVPDDDRAKGGSAEKLGRHLDHDHVVSPEPHFVQPTPLSSVCSRALGRGLSKSVPGSPQAVMLVIDDADAALEALRAAGVAAEGVDEQPRGRSVTFSDPGDGNGWTVQQLPNQ